VRLAGDGAPEARSYLIDGQGAVQEVGIMETAK
jgi:hypothetical protein